MPGNCDDVIGVARNLIFDTYTKTIDLLLNLSVLQILSTANQMDAFIGKSGGHHRHVEAVYQQGAIKLFGHSK